MESGLDYLLIINSGNEPLLFKSYKNSGDDLNIQLHCYASLDFLDDKLGSKGTQYLGQVYNIFNLAGEYFIYAFYSVTKIKILAVFKQKFQERLDDEKVKQFFLKIYRLYRRELYQPFENTLRDNQFSKKFHYLLDASMHTTSFK